MELTLLCISSLLVLSVVMAAEEPCATYKAGEFSGNQCGELKFENDRHAYTFQACKNETEFCNVNSFTTEITTANCTQKDTAVLKRYFTY